MSKKEKHLTSEEVFDLLDERYRHWENIYLDGCSDPIWPDGVNLNLVRNHIIYYKRMLEEIHTVKDGEQISFFSSDSITDTRPLPPEVECNYMAKTEQIRKDGQYALEALQTDLDVQYVLHPPQLSKDTAEKLHLAAYHGYINNLKCGLEKDDLVCVRRYLNVAYWLKCFRAEAQKIREEQWKENGNAKLV